MKEIKFSLYPALIMLLFTFSSIQGQDCNNQAEFDALMTLYDATNGPNWTDNSGWGEDCDLSTWFGISTNGAGKVTKVDLRANGLNGTLPDNWGTYTNLHTIHLQDNAINGSISPSFGSSLALKRLYLQNNALTGNIPSELGDNPLLERLNLSNNTALGGGIPLSFQNLTNLQRLHLQNNSHADTLPDILSQLIALERLYLQNNQFYGPIPSGLGNLSNLSHLYLQNNDFTGCIPEEFSNLCGDDVRLQNNECLSHANGDFSLFCLDSSCETIPNCVCPKPVDYDALMELYLATNGDQWLNNSNWGQNCDLSTWHGITTNGIDEVTKIDLRENGLTGSLPDNWDSYPALKTLLLMNNAVDGNIPSSLGSSNSITIINFNTNNLDGVLPPELGDITQLEQLIVSNNDSLSGSIPESYSNLSKLRFLYLQNNNHIGEIPASLGTIDSLERLLLQNNNFTGNIPSTFGSVSNLERLYLQNNDLEGCIPSSFSNLCTLDIRLQNNDCLSHEQGDFALFCLDPTCEIIEGCPCPQPADYLGLVSMYDSLDGPNWTNQEGWKMDCDICSWYGITCDGSGRVTRIDLRENNLGGSIPVEIGSFDNLRSLFLQGNAISDTIPASIGDLEDLLRLHLSSNNLSGEIPSSIVNLSNLENLYLQNNALVGSIPSNLDQLTNLNNLYLSNNQLIDVVPPSLGSITTLKRLSLHHNNLSGSIPVELSNLQNLEYLFLNNNQILDTIPFGLGSLNNLKYLYLSNNELEGGIPSSFGNLDSLQRLRLSHNSLVGEIPGELTNLEQLQYLFLNHNELTGGIPEGFSSTQISRLNFQNNSLSGEIPEDFANLEFIEYLYLSNNQFSGEIPSGISDGGLLKRIYLQNNNFVGDLLPEFGTLDSLTHLYVQNNDFTGCIPSSYLNLCEININLTGNDCLSHTSGDINSFCSGIPCESSNIDCALCYDGILNNGESQIDCGGVCDICRPDLAIASLVFPDSNYIPGTQLNSTIELSNIGPVGVTDTFLLMYYISEDSVLNSGTDILVHAIEYFGLDSGALDTIAGDFLIPHDITGGSYYLIVVSDLDQEVNLETNFANNLVFDQLTILDYSCMDGVLNGAEENVDCGGDECDVCPTCDDGIQNQEEVGIDCGGPNCAGCPTDLVALSFSAPAEITKTIIASFNASWGIEKASVPGNYYLGVYLSQDSILDSSDDVRIYFRNTFAARGKGKVVSFSGTNTLLVSDTIPAGDYFLIFNIEEGDLYDEYDEGNNSLFRPVSILERETCTDGIQNQDEVDVDCGGVCEVCRPDIAVVDPIFLNNNYIPGTSIIVTTDISNIGQAAVTDPFELKYYISSDSILDDSTDSFIGSITYPGIEAGGGDEVIKNAIIPNDLTGGVYYLILAVDPDNEIILEAATENNVVFNAVNILSPSCTDEVLNGTEEDIDCGGNCPACPVFDIALDQLVFEAGTSEFIIGETIDISPSYTVSNLPNQADIFSRVLLSTDTIISEEDVELGIFLDEYIGDGFYMQNYSLALPTSISPGNYHIIVRTNNSEFPDEDDYSNNIGTSEITLSLPNPCNGGEEGEEGESSGGCEECPEFTDLAMTYIFIEEEQQAPGGLLNVTTNTQNVGTTATGAGVSIEYYLSTDDNFDSEQEVLLSNAQLNSLESCQIDETVTNVLIPVGTASGDYTIFVWNTLEDATANNDLISGPITIVPAGCMDGIQNQDEENIDCGGVCPACIEICDNEIDDDGDGFVDCEDEDCGGDEACPSCTDGVMNGTETGVDCGGEECPPCILLDIVGISITPWTGNFMQYPGLSESFYVNYEILDVDAESIMEYEIYLSTDSVLDASTDVYLESYLSSENTIGTYQRASGIDLPVNTAPGDYYLIVQMDSSDEFVEADETNNTIFVEFTVLTATCDDGIQNQGETALDCGGPLCPACPVVDVVGISLTAGPNGFTQYPGLDVVFDVNYQILNTDVVPNYEYRMYLSIDSILDVSQDVSLESSFAAHKNVGTHQQGAGIDVPISTTSGDYYLIVIMDSEDDVAEEDETNNTMFVEFTVLTATCDDGVQNQGETALDCGGPLCPACPTIDIVGNNLTSGTGNFTQYPGLDVSFDVNYEILNTDAVPNFEFRMYLSEDSILDEGQDVSLESAFAAHKNVGSHQQTSGFTVPVTTTPGEYFLIVRMDSDDDIPEVDETNNEMYVPLTILDFPDLQLTIDNISNMTTPGEVMPYGITLTNANSVEVSESFKLSVYLSEDASLSASSDSIIQSIDINGISADTSYQLFENLTIPLYATAGDYYLIFWIDSEEEIAEYGTEANNVMNTFITVNTATCSDGILNQDETELDCGGVCPACETCNDGIQNQDEEGIDCGGVCTDCIKTDLDITQVEGVTSTYGGRSFNMWVNYDVTIFPVSGGVRIAAYFSEDAILDKSIDVQIVNDAGNPGSINNHRIVVLSVGIPDDIDPGEYTIIAEIDPLDEVDEVDENNNLYLLPVTILEETCSDGALNQDEEGIDCGGVCPPCLLPDAFITFTEGVTSTYAGRSFNLWVNYTIANAPLPDGVTITAYFSEDNQFDEGIDSFMKSSNQSGGQGNRRIVMTGTPIPEVAPGDYYVMVVVKPRNGASEEDSTNNTYAMPVTILEETCTDGVLNQDEEGIDCGGVCAPCALPDADITLVQGVGSTYGPRTFNLWVNYTIANAPISGGVRISAFLSDDDKYDEGIDQLMKTSIQSGGQGNRRIVMTGTPIPDVLPGSYYMVVVIDPLNVVDEEDETNNEYANPLTIIGYEDVEITMANLNLDTLSNGAQITYNVQIQSNAQKDITKTSSLGLYLSQDASYDAGVDILLDQIAIDSFVLGEIKNLQGDFIFSESPPPGPFYLIFWADNLEQLVEGVDEDNNFFNVLVDIQDPTCSDGVQNQDETGVDCGGVCVECPKYDLSITSLSMYPTTIATGAEAFINLTVENISTVDAMATMMVDYYVSENETFDASDVKVAVDSFDFIPAGEARTLKSFAVITQAIPVGAMNLIAKVNSIGSMDELDPFNNNGMIPFTILPNTCNDGVRNGDEEGVDCGGSCPNECSSCTYPQEEVDALMVLFDSLGGENWINKNGWGEDCNICNWDRISCQDDGLYSIFLDNNGLNGTLPPAIGLLQNLDFLYLKREADDINNIYGTIPPEIGNLPNVRQIQIRHANLTGTIPVEITNLPRLHGLALDHNNLTGRIPSDMGNMASINWLRLENNQLEGCIPSSLSSLCGKPVFRLQNNPGLLPNGGDVFTFCYGGFECEPAIGERGTALISSDWSLVNLELNYEDPVIIAGPLGNNEDDAATIRIRNVNENSFEIRIEEWDCIPGDHALEVVGYVVFEAGSYELENGIKLTAVTTQLSQSAESLIAAPFEYNADYSILSQVVSTNDVEAVSIQTTHFSGDTSYFELKLQEAKNADNSHQTEDVSIIVVESGVSNDGSLFEAGNTAAAGDATSSVNFAQTYGNPIFVGKVGSSNELEPFSLRYTTITSDSATVYINEDNSCGSGSGGHGAEEVHYMVFDGPGLIYGQLDGPDLAFTDFQFDGNGLMSGDLISFSYDITNQGTLTASPFEVHFYLAKEDININPDTRLELISRQQYYILPAGQTFQEQINDLYIPHDALGDYYLIAKIDKANIVYEINELNNDYQSASFTIVPALCNNGVLDPGEIEVDCGGSCPNECPVILDFDEACAVQFEEETFVRLLDDELEVGTTIGYPAVNPIGAATYTIPIPMAPGTKGMQPNLSLEYNSQGKNGIAGYGWSILGNSSITRNNKSIYYDGFVGPIALNNDDVFSLDGARLQVTNLEPYGSSNAEYCAEVEDFSVVTPMEVTVNGPKWFEVKTKSGLILEYGKSNNSSFLAEDGLTAIYWNLSRSYDSNGNYMDYIYDRVGDELLLTSILYTGNESANLEPYNRIDFTYHERGDKNISYVVGQRMTMNHLLSKIEVKSKGLHVRSFDLCYAHGPVTSGLQPLRSYLQEIQESGVDALTKLNSTMFLYGEKTSSAPVINMRKTTGDHIIRGVNPEDYNRVGDFNGDGLDDIAIFRAEERNDITLAYEVEIYMNQSVDNDDYVFIGTEPLEEYLDLAGKRNNVLTFIGNLFVGYGLDLLLGLIPVAGWILIAASIGLGFIYSPIVVALLGSGVYGGNFTFQTADLNGDNREEIILYTPDFDSKSGEEKIFSIGVNESNEIIIDDYPYLRNKKDKVENYNLGDYDGDSKLDFLIVLGNGKDDDDEDRALTDIMIGLSSKAYMFESVVIDPGVGATIEDLTDARFMSGNFDGDTKSDLLVTGGNTIGSRILTFDHTQSVTHLKTILDKPAQILNYPTKYHAIVLGDFNGDGKADVLSGNQRGKWEVGYFDGDNFNRVGFSFESAPSPTLEFDEHTKSLIIQDKQQLLIADMNSDGMSDILYQPLKNVDCWQDHYDHYNDTPLTCYTPELDSINFYYSAGYSFVREAIENDFVKYYNPKWGYTIDQFDLGDFNGDGIADLLSNRYQIKYINVNSEELLMTDVLDGFNNRYSFKYKPMADTSVYKQTDVPLITEYSHPNAVEESSPTFPLNKITAGIRLVHQMKAPDGLNNGQNNTITYSYKDAIYHRLGKGFIGFTDSEMSNQNQDRVTITKNGINDEFFISFPISTDTKIKSTNEVISSSASDFTFLPRGNLRFWMRPDDEFSSDFVNNRKVIVNTVFKNDIFGNIDNKSIFKTGINGSTRQFNRIYYDDYVNNGSHIPYLPSTVVSFTSGFDGGDPLIDTTTYIYNNEGAILEKRNFKGYDQEIITTFTSINDFGVPTAATITAANGDVDPRSSSMIYDSTGRFIIEAINALNQSSTASYDTRWGVVDSVLDVSGNLTTFEYDEFGRRQKMTVPAGYDVFYDYHWDIRNGVGTTTDEATDAVFYTEIIHPAEPDIRTWYNAVGKARMSTTQDFKHGEGQYFDNSLVRTYDKRGRLSSVTNTFRPDQTPLYTNYKYDIYNRPDTIISPTGQNYRTYSADQNGHLTTVFTQEDGLTRSEVTDLTGRLIESEDTGGESIEYSFLSNGNPESITVDGEVVSTMFYDEYARQDSLFELNSGGTAYRYNSFGEIIYQKDSRPNIGPTTVAYDNVGRVDFIDQHEGHIEYTYVTSGNGLNRLENIVNYNGLTESFEYDELSRLTRHTEMINSKSFVHEYSYTDLDQLDSIAFPSGLTVDYDYYGETGFVKHLKDHNGNVIYEPLESNQYGQMTQYLLGNGLTTKVSYDQFGVLDEIESVGSNVFHMSFDFNVQNGLLNSRTDHKVNLTESFGYDDHYRLINANVDNDTTLFMTYDDNGNILTKSDVSAEPYLYQSDKIHALTGIPKPGPISVHDQDVIYNSAHQPTSITEDDYLLQLTYGSDEQRRHAHFTKDGVDQYERYYCGNYEEQIINGVEEKIHYLEAGIIVVQKDNGPFEYYYTYGDYLGSVLAVTDDVGTLLQRQSFDSWGRRRNSTDWSQDGVVPNQLTWLYRGYTGHEMLPTLGIINMNGRLYDPMIGRMFSVDNYSGQNGTSQSFNRYSYVYNNPLMYNDPGGEFPSCLTLADFSDIAGFLASGGLLDVNIIATRTVKKSLLQQGLTAGSKIVKNATIVAKVVINEAIASGKEVVNHSVATIAGAANAIGSNGLLDMPGMRQDPNDFGDYAQSAANGQFVGDVISLLWGMGEQVTGASAAATGVVTAIPSGGVSLTMTAGGVAVAAHGAGMTQSAWSHLMNDDYIVRNKDGSGGSNNNTNNQNGSNHSDKGNYTNPGTHDPKGGPQKYNENKSVLPDNHEDLWKESVMGSDGNRWTKEGKGKKAVYHRFFGDKNGDWHWSGSTNGITRRGYENKIDLDNVPPAIKRL